MGAAIFGDPSKVALCRLTAQNRFTATAVGRDRRAVAQLDADLLRAVSIGLRIGPRELL